MPKMELVVRRLSDLKVISKAIKANTPESKINDANRVTAEVQKEFLVEVPIIVPGGVPVTNTKT